MVRLFLITLWPWDKCWGKNVTKRILNNHGLKEWKPLCSTVYFCRDEVRVEQRELPRSVVIFRSCDAKVGAEKRWHGAPYSWDTAPIFRLWWDTFFQSFLRVLLDTKLKKDFFFYPDLPEREGFVLPMLEDITLSLQCIQAPLQPLFWIALR